MTTRILRALFVAVLIVAFAALVWPTRWRYDHMTVDGDTYPVRIHRLTGHAELLLPGDGWTPVEDAFPDSDSQDEEPNPRT